MAVDANVTELSDLTGTTVNEVLAARAVESFKEQNIMLPFVRLEQFPEFTDTVQVPKLAGLSSASVAESAETDVVQWSTSSVDITRGKDTVMIELTDEALVGGGISTALVQSEMTRALNEGVEQALMALFNGFSTSVGTTNTALEPVDLPDAARRLDAQKIPGPRICVLSPKGVFDIQNNIITTATASVWSNPNTETFLGMIGMMINNKLRGVLGGIPVYQSANVSNDGTDDFGGMFAPDYALGVAFPRRAVDIFKFEIVKGDQGVTFGSQFVKMTVFYGVAEIVDEAGVELIHVD